MAILSTPFRLFFTAAAAATSLLPSAFALQTLDLSQDFPVGNTDNSDAAAIEAMIDPGIYRLLVIDDGTIVMEYQADSVRDDDEAFIIHSVTKTWSRLLIGMIIESPKYNLSMDDKLGDIFSEESAWELVTDETEREIKKNITIYEMMTMTDGLMEDWENPALGENLAEWLEYYVINGTEKDSLVGMGNFFGVDVDTSDYRETSFIYLLVENILSYVVHEVTGMTPLDFASVEVFPFLGIDPERPGYLWETDSDGMQLAGSGMHLTARQMAKLPQLYLQKGYAAPDQSLVSDDFINASLSPISYTNMNQGRSVGMLWWLLGDKDNDPDFPAGVVDPSLPGKIWCGAGFAGQLACLNHDTGRVVVVQRNDTSPSSSSSLTGDEDSEILVIAAMSTDRSFAMSVVDAPESKENGGSDAEEEKEESEPMVGADDPMEEESGAAILGSMAAAVAVVGALVVAVL